MGLTTYLARKIGNLLGVESKVLSNNNVLPSTVVKDVPNFKVPDVYRNYLHDPDVAIFSYYLKILGTNQDLRFGDFYYISVDGKPVIKRYEKSDFDYSDFEFQTNSNYVRMVTESEACNIINSLGFDFTENGMFISPTLCTICVSSNFLSLTLAISAKNIHACYARAAYICSSMFTMIGQSNDQIKKSGLLNFEYGG